MCMGHSLYDAITLVGVLVLIGWMWWVMFNAR